MRVNESRSVQQLSEAKDFLPNFLSLGVKVDHSFFADANGYITTDSVAKAVYPYTCGRLDFIVPVPGPHMHGDGLKKLANDAGTAFTYEGKYETASNTQGNSTSYVESVSYAKWLIAKIEASIKRDPYDGDDRPNGVASRDEWDAFANKYS
ncbi:MAG: hypothetical protein V4691_03695 [Pseudomonadota bacterium]